MDDSITTEQVLRLALALGIGLLVGAERERRMEQGGRRGPAGIRTFALVGLLGGVADQIGEPSLLVAGFAFVAAAALLGYFREGTLGITTEVALVIAYMLGVLAQRDPSLASGLAVGVTIVLATRTSLHRFVSSVLTEQEVHDALLLGAAALVVLPLLPNEAVDPFDVLNPFAIWRLVVLLMVVSSAGYFAVRTVGPRFGLPIAGLLGGFVSSTATIGAMGNRSREHPGSRKSATSAAIFSTVATFVQMAIVLAAVHPPTLRELGAPLALGGLAAVATATASLVGAREAPSTEDIDYGRAFDLRPAVLLAATVSLVTFISAAGSEVAGEGGVLVAAIIGGLPDTHAAAIGVASVVDAGKLSASGAAIPVLAALSSNTVSKLVMAAIGGGRDFAMSVGAGLLLVLGAAWAGLLLPGI